MWFKKIIKLVLILNILRSSNLVNGKRTLNIFHGKAADIDLMPYMCHIFVINGTELQNYDYYDYSACPGSYISKHWVLTVAHCFGTFVPLTQKKAVDRIPPQEIRICMGTEDADVDRCDFQRTADRVIVHENWFETGDIGLLHIKEPFSTGPKIQMVKIPHKHINMLRMYRYKECLMGGWGIINKFNDVPKVFQMAKVKVYPKKCPVYRRMICAKGVKGSGCAGDTGSPLVCEGMQIGIFATGDQSKCDNQNNLMFFERLDRHIGWLHNYVSADSTCTIPNYFFIATLAFILKFI